MILDIVSASASWADDEFHVSFGVVPEDDCHLDLKTGEIFQNPRYTSLRYRNNKTIPATLFVARQAQSAVGAELPSEMRYITEIDGLASEINLVWRLTEEHLAKFHSLLLAGQTPRKAVISFPSRTIGFGWEPDGSGRIWENQESQSVPLENVSFKFSLQTAPTSDPWNSDAAEDDEVAFFSNPARVTSTLMRRLSSIQSSVVLLSWLAGLIVLLMLGQMLSRYWH